MSTGWQVGTSYDYAVPSSYIKLIESADIGDYDGVLKSLKDEADVHYKSDYALKISSKKGYIEIVKLLLDNGANIHAGCTEDELYNPKPYPQYKKDVALRFAVEKRHINVVKFLLKKGADPHIDNEYPLIFSAQEGFKELVELLIVHGANIHYNYDHALHIATTNKHIEIVKILLENGANPNNHNPNVKDSECLGWAIVNNDVSIVKLLLDYGAIVTEAFLNLAKAYENETIIDLIQKYKK